MLANAELFERARAWRDQDPDEETRAELDALVTAAEAGDASAVADLADRFAGRLQFGTAGLRGELAAGPMRMNRVLVAQAAAGFAAFLTSREEHPSIVIGYDGRKNSRRFALDTAEIMEGAGVRATLLPRMLPTPVLAFAVRHLDVSAGVMVTASHNPPNDNGYKVYLGGADAGSQIISPVDKEIAALIDEAAGRDIRELPRRDSYATADESVIDAYVKRTVAVARTPAPVDFVYTAMHGVGWEVSRRVFVDAGFGEPTVVAEQIEPNAAFPTVAFPNPEEPGAMDLAYETATRAGADLILAHDPDADRLAVAIPDAGTEAGWRRLTGNEVGALLGWRAAEASAGTGALAASLVSSPALAAVAREYGLEHRDTLTGFKYVSRVPGLVYGYEEALGYLVDPDKLRDKDGISAAVAFLDLVAGLAARGLTVEDRLREFAEKFGAFASGQVSVRVADLARIPEIMARMRQSPPASLGGSEVVGVDDFALGVDGFEPANIVRFRLADGSRVIVRPSGTEPKVKVYLDASIADGPVDERMARAEARIAALDADVRSLLA